jgi:hypothetical protein
MARKTEKKLKLETYQAAAIIQLLSRERARMKGRSADTKPDYLNGMIVALEALNIDGWDRIQEASKTIAEGM